MHLICCDRLIVVPYSNQCNVYVHYCRKQLFLILLPLLELSGLGIAVDDIILLFCAQENFDNLNKFKSSMQEIGVAPLIAIKLYGVLASKANNTYNQYYY